MLSCHASSHVPVLSPLIPHNLKHKGLFALESLCRCGGRRRACTYKDTLNKSFLYVLTEPCLAMSPDPWHTGWISKRWEVLPAWPRRERSHSPPRQLAGVPCTPQGGAAVLEGVAAMTKGTRWQEACRAPWQQNGAGVGVWGPVPFPLKPAA